MQYTELALRIEEQINSIIIGKADKVRLAMITLLSGGHLLIEDIPGVGKTTLALAIAKSIRMSFGRIQFTPDTLPSDITGMSIYNMKTGEFDFYNGPVMNNIILADEINRTSPKTQASLLEAMEEHQVTIDGRVHVLEAPFMVIATQNPLDFTGTYRLPEAQLDRFMMRISIGYPSVEEECTMAQNNLKGFSVRELSPVAAASDIVGIQEEVKSVRVHPDITRYILDIITQTRLNKLLLLGASPRATLALQHAAQAVAYLGSRDFVTPDDIKQVYKPVLCHRLILSSEAKLNNTDVDTILTDLLRNIKVPVILK